MKYFLVTYEIVGDSLSGLLIEVLKSLNFTRQVMPNVWITAGSRAFSDAKTIFDYLRRFVKPEDVIFVTQIATPVSMQTVHGNISHRNIADMMSA